MLVFNRGGEWRRGSNSRARSWQGELGEIERPGSGIINLLPSEKLTDMGNSATFYSVLFGVEGFGAPGQQKLVHTEPVVMGVLDAVERSTV